MSCCGNDNDPNGPKWKREIIQDHKFDFVDVDEFYDDSWFTKISYSLVFIVVIKSGLVYMADLWTAVSLLVIGEMTIEPFVPIQYTKWIFLGCIMLSFLLLALDIRKARMIVASHDISYAFTSVIASRYYTLRSYSHYCFFNKIHNSKKTTDEIAFFVFFTLKGWKRLLLADAPRAVINALTLFPTIKLIWIEWVEENHDGPVGTASCPYGDPICNDALWDNFVSHTSTTQKLLMCTMTFSLLLFIISAIMVIIASIVYIPLLCHIRGNLKEYCCHKIDKRIAELLRRQAKKRVLQMREKELANKKAALKGGDIPMKNMAVQPTLPQLDLYDDFNRPLSAGYGDHYVKTPLMTERGYGSPAPTFASPRMPYQQSPYMGGGPARRGSVSSFTSEMTGWTGGHPSPGNNKAYAPPMPQMPDGSYEYHKTQEHMYKDSNFNPQVDSSPVSEPSVLGYPQNPNAYQYAPPGGGYEGYYNNYSPSPVIDRRAVPNPNAPPMHYDSSAPMHYESPAQQGYDPTNRF